MAQVGGLLTESEDPVGDSRTLASLIGGESTLSLPGYDPLVGGALRRRIEDSGYPIEVACLMGAAWAVGRSSAPEPQAQLAVSVPVDDPLPIGARTTGDALISLVGRAQKRLRVTAPFVDDAGLEWLAEGLIAAAARGVRIEIFSPATDRGRAAVNALLPRVPWHAVQNAQVRYFQHEGPWAHLKVLLSDFDRAYVGSANLTGTGIGGGNLELGVIVAGAAVAQIDSILDRYASP